jgi:hypothetical protein
LLRPNPHAEIPALLTNQKLSMYLLYIESSEAIMYLGFGILTIIVWCFLIRWAVRADSIVRNQQAMIWFLILQCKKQGIADEEIQKLKDHFGIK